MFPLLLNISTISVLVGCLCLALIWLLSMPLRFHRMLGVWVSIDKSREWRIDVDRSDWPWWARLYAHLELDSKAWHRYECHTFSRLVGILAGILLASLMACVGVTVIGTIYSLWQAL